MSPSSSDKRNSIDLGLSALLSSVGAPEPSPPQNGSYSEPVTEPPKPNGEASSFQQLHAQKRWQELITSAESALAAAPSPVTSLWWIRGHLGALSMPVSFLISPFEEAARASSAAAFSQDDRRLLEETAALMLERLQNVGERAQVEAFQSLLKQHQIAEVNGSLGKHRHAWTLSTQPPELPNGTASSGAGAPSTAAPRARRRIGRLLLLAVLLLLLLLGALLALKPLLNVLPKKLSLEPYLRERPVPEQEAPAIAPQDPVGDLSALYYSIDGAKTPPTAPEGSQANRDTGGSQDASAPENSASSGAPARQKERVDTSGPVESEEYRRGAAQRSAAGSNNAGNAPQPNLPRDRGARSTPFDRQIEAQQYTVIVETNVVASPSYVAPVLGRLQPGDIVMVESRVGAWVRLRSRRGNAGYVLAQDVTRGKSGEGDPYNQ